MRLPAVARRGEPSAALVADPDGRRTTITVEPALLTHLADMPIANATRVHALHNWMIAGVAAAVLVTGVA